MQFPRPRNAWTDEIRTVLATSDVPTRNRHINAHLRRLEEQLGRTQRAVAALRDLLSPPAAADSPAIEHCGPPSEVDRAYGALAAYVTRHALSVAGPIREYYLLGQRHTPDSTLWRTEVGWPVFRTGGAGSRAA
jgi:hypothetical protein